MTTANQNIPTSFFEGVKDNAALVVAVGVLLLLMGILVLTAPLIAGTSVLFIVGLAVLIGGISQLVFAFKSSAGLMAYLLGGLSVILGIYMVNQPAAALGGLTLILTIYLVLSGLLEIYFAFMVKPAEGWGVALFSGVMAVLLGIMIWSQYPFSGAWAIGMLLGTRLFLAGFSLTSFGLAARRRAIQSK